MAAKETVSWTFVDKKEKVEEVVAIFKKKSVLFVDAEGNELGRVGKMCLLQIATDEDTYLFDVITLGAELFDSGIEDLQLMNTIRRKLTDQRWEFLSGLGKCMGLYLADRQFSYSKKDDVRKKMDSDKELWSKRPLTEDLLCYAATDVHHLSALRDKMNAGLSISNHQLMEKMLPYCSERYAAFLRDNPYYSRDSPYLRNARIPEGIIPDVHGSNFIRFEDYGGRCKTCYQFTHSSREQCSRCLRISHC